jgi:hypothetical protein
MKFNSIKKIGETLSLASIELHSDRRVILMDCKSVIDYSEECMVLDIGDKRLRIRGEGLVADSFSFGQTDIRGRIISLEFI